MASYTLSPYELVLEDGSHFALSCLYVLVGILTVYLRFGGKAPSHRAIWQLTFSIALILGILLRAVFFYLQPLNSGNMINIPNSVNFIMGTLPPFLFLACYMLILFLWAEIYHEVTGEQEKKMKYIYFGIQGVLHGLVIISFIVNAATAPVTISHQVTINEPLERAVMIIDAILYILTALGYLVYGIGFYYKFTRVNRALLAKMRRTILPKVKYMTALTSLCFFVRGGMTLSNAFSNWPNAFWWFDSFYYIVLEIVPVILMLFILRASKPSSNAQSAAQINRNPYSDQQIEDDDD